MNLIEWINGITKLNKSTMDNFQNNIKAEFNALIGSGMDYYGTVAPTNYMFADGSAISRTEYSELFAIIGETYGAGDGSTTFNLPDRRQKISIMAGDGDTIGETVGSNSITLTKNNLPNVQIEVPILTTFDKGSYGSPSNTNTFAGNVVISKGGEQDASFQTEALGKGAAIDIRQESLVCNYIIKVK